MENSLRRTNSKTKVKMTLPGFNSTREVLWKFHVTNDLLNYDVIVGRDLLEELGMILDFSKEIIKWEESHVPMVDTNTPTEDLASHAQQAKNEVFATLNGNKSDIKRTMEAKYVKADLDSITDGMEHLSSSERTSSKEVLKNDEELFDGTLGTWRAETLDVESKPGVSPCHAKPCPTPKAHEQTLEDEVDRLCKAGVLQKVN